MAYTKYSLTPANNNAAPPDGAPEGMLPSAVNDTMRDMMAQIRDVGDGIRGGTYTMTAPVITGGSITGVALSGNTFTNPVITGGSINNTPIGASTANTGAFTTLSATGATTFSGATVVSGSLTANTFSSSGATITGGSINSTAIGGSTAAAGAFTTLSASGVATFSAGTVSAPAITTTGDTNTGIFFPAADTIAFTEGGVESMRIDSSGNVGIGTSSPNKTSSNRAFTLNAPSAANYSAFELTSGDATNFYLQANNSVANIVSTGTIPMVFYTNSAERMRIDSSGRMLIGASTALSTSPRLQVQRTDATVGATNYQLAWFQNSTGFGNGIGIYAQDNVAAISADFSGASGGAAALAFYTNSTTTPLTPTERMRITSGGEVYIAGTTDQGAYNLQCNGTGVWGAGAYVNGSDERIKDDIAPLDSGLDVVSKLNPVTYKYKENWSKDQSTQTGFIAQELLTALEGKNYVDGVVQQGGEYMSVAYQNIIPILTKAIQELKDELDATKAEVALLKSK